MTIQPEITLNTRRCFKCGRWYGYENDCGMECPCCQWTSNKELRREIERLNRANNALRGAFKKLKGSK